MLKEEIAISNSKVYSLYNDEVKLIFNPFGHRYTIDEREIVGVTTILKTIIAKEALVGWAVKVTGDYVMANYSPKTVKTAKDMENLISLAKKAHRAKKEDAADLGTRVHKWIETYIEAKQKGITLQLIDQEDIRKPVESFLQWEKEHKVEWISSERPVYSRRFDYCGTMDFLAKVDGKLMVGDLKTSKAIYPEQYYLQVAGYRYALIEEHPEMKIDGMIIIRIPKEDGDSIEIREPEESNYKEYATAFIYAVKLYNTVTKLKNIR